MGKQKNLPIKIRRAIEEDVPFIFNSWLKSFRNGSWGKMISNTVYFTEHHKVLERLAKTSEILVACNKDDTNQIYGYIVAEKIDGIFVLHYVYTKHPYRRLGIARSLLNTFDHNTDYAGCYTHHNKIAEKLAIKYNLIHHPYLLMNYEIKEIENVSNRETENESSAR